MGVYFTAFICRSSMKNTRDQDFTVLATLYCGTLHTNTTRHVYTEKGRNRTEGVD